MGVTHTEGGDDSLLRPLETRAEAVTAQLEKATMELRASRERSQQIQVEINQLANMTDEVLARIKTHLSEG